MYTSILPCNAPQCRRPFFVGHYPAGLITHPRRQNIFCPYCNALQRGDASRVYVTFPFTPAEERRFKEQDHVTDLVTPSSAQQADQGSLCAR